MSAQKRLAVEHGVARLPHGSFSHSALAHRRGRGVRRIVSDRHVCSISTVQPGSDVLVGRPD